MAIWPFNRKKQSESVLPKEVQDYYQAEKRERVGVAGLLALATLVVTVLLATGLFFGGRWAYRTVFNNNDKPTSQPAPSTPSGTTDTPKPSTTPTSSTPTTTTPTTPASTPTSAGSSANTTSSSTSVATTASNSTALSNTNADGLPDTGPGNIALVATLAAITSGAGYYTILRPKNRS